MDIYDVTVPQLQRALRNLDRWLGLAAVHADADKLLTAKLAPDQFNLIRQVQTASDNAKMMPGRLAGKQWPSHPDTETTYEQLRARLASVVEYLETFTREDFAEAHERKIKLPWMKDGQYMDAVDYLVQFGLPNFYFHVVTAYAILRHRGLPMGKFEYLGSLSIQA
jgi:hypothetical protein